MKSELDDLDAFLAVARAGGFRDAARMAGVGASSMSEAVRRVETRLGVRLLTRTTRSVFPTEAGARLVARLAPVFEEMTAALDEVNRFRERPVGTLRLNVPLVAARLVLPELLPAFLAAYPDITLEVVVEDGFVDLPASGCDAGIRYEERLEQDMIAVPIGPREERIATAAAPAYLNRRGRPTHPSDLLSHACLLGRFSGGALTSPWEFEKNGEIVKVAPTGPLIVRVAAIDLAIAAAVAGTGVIHLFERWLGPQLESGALEPILTDWWQPFSGPFLYYPGRRLVPAPLRAFIDFVRNDARSEAHRSP